jgi:hypothetical protein
MENMWPPSYFILTLTLILTLTFTLTLILTLILSLTLNLTLTQPTRRFFPAPELTQILAFYFIRHLVLSSISSHLQQWYVSFFLCILKVVFCHRKSPSPVACIPSCRMAWCYWWWSRLVSFPGSCLSCSKLLALLWRSFVFDPPLQNRLSAGHGFDHNLPSIRPGNAILLTCRSCNFLVFPQVSLMVRSNCIWCACWRRDRYSLSLRSFQNMFRISFPTNNGKIIKRGLLPLFIVAVTR